MNLGFLDRVTATLAQERLDAYRQDGAAADVALARYVLNLALCEALYGPLHLAEVALRNALHRTLSARYGTEAWHDLPQVPLTPWQRIAIGEARRHLEDQRKPLNSGRIVAELSFGFWTGLFNKRQARTGLGFHLAKCALPFAPKSERDLAKLDARCERLRALRNRVFHHERIVHFADLEAQHMAILEVIAWISPELHEMARALDRFTTIRQGGLRPWLDKLSHHWRDRP